MHFPSSRKVIFIFSVHWEPRIVTVSRCERGTGEKMGEPVGGGRKGAQWERRAGEDVRWGTVREGLRHY